MGLWNKLKGNVGTERLVLRKWKKKDFQDFMRQVGDAEVMLAAGIKPVENEKEAQKLFRRILREGQFAIVLQETGAVIGNFQFGRDLSRRNIGSYVIGYWLEKPYWGKGYMTEALKAMVRYGFEKKNAEVLAVGHEVGNEGSRRVIEKCGFHYEGTRRMAFRRSDGEVFDDECYSLLREEYYASIE